MFLPVNCNKSDRLLFVFFSVIPIEIIIKSLFSILKTITFIFSVATVIVDNQLVKLLIQDDCMSVYCVGTFSHRC